MHVERSKEYLTLTRWEVGSVAEKASMKMKPFATAKVGETDKPTT